MSGHSHWQTIKRAKEVEDKKRAQVFSKFSRLISLAVKEKGKNIETNPNLRMIIEKAKKNNMPKESIEKAIKKGAGEIQISNLKSFLVEAYGPGGIAIIIQGSTDNKNRALSEIKQILSQNNGKLVDEGSIKWMFDKKGIIKIDFKSQNLNFKNKEEMELAIIEAGAEDIHWDNSLLNVYVKHTELEEIKQKLKAQNIKIESASLNWIAKELIEVNEKDKIALQKLFEALNNNNNVQKIYSNFKFTATAP